MSDITNTSQHDPLIHLAGSLGSGGTEGYITDMEAAGQRELVNSDKLPAEALGQEYGTDGWTEFEALGFIKGEPVPGDALFVNATLPEGWSREPSGHDMWSYIVDERGVRRVAIFYKAAFYDRRAHMNLHNPGYSMANEVIYGEGKVAIPDLWSVLTEDERTQFVSAIDEYRKRAAEHPDIYNDKLNRAMRLVQLIEKSGA